MHTLLRNSDFLLRGGLPATNWRTPILLILLFGPIYGAVMGSYAFNHPERLLQILYAALKVPLLLTVSTLICLPGFFVLNTVLGLRDDFRAAFGFILAGQAAMSLTLAALAPLTLVFYASTSSYQHALLFNALMFTIGASAAQMVMRRGYTSLVASRTLHRFMFWTWAAMYAFVGIQMGWTLRPFVGSPGAFPTFFRNEPFTNAYIEVFTLISNTLRGR